MPTEAQSAAQMSLNSLESNFIMFGQEEQSEIEVLREHCRKLVQTYGASAELAIIAVGFEIAIKEKQ